jgi:Zn-dependent peptidase ImmA (M78 family)/transcriptional regulator with XRE-family HTH domain
MKVGASGFIGERLTEAREARGIMSKSALAELLDLSSNAISQYENNVCKPRYEVLSQIAGLLKVKESFFFRPLTPQHENPIFWRSRHAATKASRVVAKRKFNWAKSISDEYLKTYLDFPELVVPSRKDLRVPDDPKNLSDSGVEEIASSCRSYWGLGKSPINNLTVLLEDHGLLITYGSLESPKLDAFSSVSEIDHSFHMFLSTDSRSAARSRFDAAHELGHLILHSHLSTDYFEAGKKTERHALTEHQAYRFASSFLMPADSFRSDVWMTALEPLLSLKEEWKVSVKAMIKRCDDLGMLDESHARRLWINYNRQWKDGEPDDDKIPFEQAELMKRCFDALIESKVKTKAEILREIAYSQRDIETLMNLPEGYFNEDFGELRSLPTIKPDLQIVGGKDSATIFDFESKKPR